MPTQVQRSPSRRLAGGGSEAGAGAAAGGDEWDYGNFASNALAAAPDAATEHIMAMLRPMALECAWKFEGSKARARCGAPGAEHITPRVVDALSKVTKWLQKLLLEWGQQHAAVLAWSRRLATEEGAEEGRQMAWVALGQARRGVQPGQRAGAAGARWRRKRASRRARGAPPDCTPSEAAWLAEFGDGSLMGLEVLVRLQGACWRSSSSARWQPSWASCRASWSWACWPPTPWPPTSRRATPGCARCWRKTSGARRWRAATPQPAPRTALAIFEFKNYPERVGSVLLLEPGDAE
jgi:hypothetical protein